MKDVKEKFRNIDIWSFDGKGDINNILKFESIFFYINKYNNEYYEYPFLEQLFLELDNKFTQNDLIVKFGKPEAYSDNWIRYSINNKYIHFEFNDLKELSQITLFIK